MAQIDAPASIEIALRRKNGKLLLHLGNCTAMQVATEYATVDAVPSVGPIRIRLRTPKPSRVTLEPEGRTIAGSRSNGIWTGTVERLDVHAIVAYHFL
jgi:hypothetical protein